MKKVLLLAVMGIMAACASAQVVRSTTYVKEKTPTQWYVRAGLSFNNYTSMTGADADGKQGMKMGAEFDLGFQRPIKKSGAYWGMELGIGSRGGTYEWDDKEDGKYSYSAWNVKYSPITFGYQYAVTENIKIDGHIGAFVSYDFSKSCKFSIDKKYKEYWSDFEIEEEEEWGKDLMEDFDVGLQIGVGVWVKKFNVDLTYQRGFMDAMSADETKAPKSSNLMLRVGYAF